MLSCWKYRYDNICYTQIFQKKDFIMSQEIGERMVFTGGAENSPTVEVSTFNCPGSLNNGCKTLRITQSVNGREQTVSLSPGTMISILGWYHGMG
jgi:hypothetical protein